MTKKQRSALRRFRRVLEFLKTNQVEGTRVKLQVLEQVVNGMSDEGEARDASTRVTRGETARQRALRDAVWNQHMVPISRIARRAFGVPGMPEKLSLPVKREDSEWILNSARGMALATEQHAEVFVTREGLPADFLQRFKSAINELDAARSTRVESQNRKKTSGQTLNRLVKVGVAALDVLDAIVKARLETRPELAAAWNSVKRPIEVGGGGSAVSGELTIAPVVKVA